ncbi:NHLP leader peptide family natural product precursor [Paenibacillus sp. IB182496]|uniref:NHLP leader peptide family natural product n=1 Tax=Paenibacillus sabuli TaxID=2772509 RepID=A0A927GRR0_9BACL|nr:NHLP leader peptide family RiPP precursor [Paenibacillus sabuli]MBD2844937.1 NHLP leader peptide family natural product precursor [Paenibacillus sabuli]
METLRAQIIKKAWTDAAFKQQLLSDPKKALKDEFDVDVPAAYTVTTVEETPTHYYLVIPPNPEDVANSNLSPNAVW